MIKVCDIAYVRFGAPDLWASRASSTRRSRWRTSTH